MRRADCRLRAVSAKNGSASVDLNAAIDELYRAPLDRFTTERNTLATELRKSGDRAAADRVKGLAKPSVTAWAVNQAWWRDQSTFQAMLDAGQALQSAHVARAHGQAADVRAAAVARQQAVDAVVEAAVKALGGSAEVGPDARHRIAGTVEALASSGAPADAAMGRLSRDLQASGLEALSALAGALPASAGSSPVSRPVIVSRTAAKPAKAKPADGGDAKAVARERDRQVAEAKSALTGREAALRAASSEATQSATAEKKARGSLETATGRVADLEQKLESARDHERESRRALAQATKAASEVEMIRVRTARDVKAAREQLDDLLK